MAQAMVSHGIEVVSVTLALVAVIILAAFFAKKLNLNKYATQRGFQILSQQSLGPREKIVLLNFSGKNLLVGIVPGSITLLAESDTVRAEKKDRFAHILNKEQVG